MRQGWILLAAALSTIVSPTSMPENSKLKRGSPLSSSILALIRT
mgnify:CR=1 FL=1